MNGARHRYGDFPELFCDAQPDELVDTTNAVVLARLISKGSMVVIRELLDPETLRQALPALPVIKNCRRFRGRVLDHIPVAHTP